MENERQITESEFYAIINQKEGDFLDFKSKLISGSSLQETIVALANADGGDIYIGIKDEKEAIGESRLDGFNKIEEANQLLINCFQLIKPSLMEAKHEFLLYKGNYILSLLIPAKDVVYKTSSNKVFLRKGAQDLCLNKEQIKVLEYSKGARKREDEVLNIGKEIILDSDYLKEYCKRVPIIQSPEIFLKKETLIYQDKPRVASVISLSDCPHSCMKCGVKIYRLRFNKTESRSDYKRAVLDEKNIFTIEGSAEVLVLESVKKVKEIMENMKFKQYGKEDSKLKYPLEAIHEVVANAILHRDYSIEDDVHIRIFDNQIEVSSPGGFPGNVTPKNIKNVRYSRNPRIVRILHKLPNKVNKDLGEGVDTIFNTMREAKLSLPIFEEKDNYVVVTLKHSPIASYEEQILNYLKEKKQITNREARKITGEEDKVKIKNVFLKLVKHNKIKIGNPEETKDKRVYCLN